MSCDDPSRGDTEHDNQTTGSETIQGPETPETIPQRDLPVRLTVPPSLTPVKWSPVDILGLMSAQAKREKKARQQKKPDGHLVEKLPVWGAQAEFVIAQISASAPGGDDSRRRFIAHLLGGHGLKESKIPGRGFTPVSYKLLRPLASDHNANSVWAPLRDAGLIEVENSDRFKNLSAGYRLAVGFAEAIVERAVTTAEAALTSPRVDLVSGRKTTTVRKSEITDSNGKKHPELVRGALKVLSRSPFYAPAVEAHLDDLRHSAGAARAMWIAARKPASGPAWDQHVKERGRLLNDLSGYSAVLHQRIAREDTPGVYTYATAYRPLMSGRIGQLGRGLQGASKRMKAAAYSGVPGARNYDLQACHANVLIERLGEAGLDPSWFVLFADDRDCRRRDASRIGIPESDYKACIYSLVNGAALPRNPKPGDDPGDIAERILGAVGIDGFGPTWGRLVDVLAPAHKVVRQWHRYLKETYDAAHGGTGRGGRFVTNRVGMRFYPEHFPKDARVRKLVAFVLRGYEAALVHTLTVLSRDYDYMPIANEHDGLITIGEIPDEAFEEAKQRVGVVRGLLKEKLLASEEDYASLRVCCHRAGFELPTGP